MILNLATRLALVALPLTASCAAANTLVNIQHRREINEINGRILIIECRALAQTPRGSEMLSGEGETVGLNFQFAPPLLFTRNPDARAWLIPAEESWSIFRALLQRDATAEMVDWNCAQGLRRSAEVEAPMTAARFSAVPPGSYDLFVRWSGPDGSTRIRCGGVEIGPEPSASSVTLVSVPDEKQGDLSQSY